MAELIKELRASIQTHDSLAYCFAGSKKHMLSEIFLKENAPFFHSGKVFSLKKIPHDEFYEFLLKHFSKLKVGHLEDKVKEINTFTSHHPYYTQMLAYHAWEEWKDREETPVTEVINAIVIHQNDAYLTLWNLLTSKQRNILRALAHDVEWPLSQAATVVDWDLGSSATVSKVIAYLEQQGFIEREEKMISVTDPFFKTWIKQR